MESSGSSSNQYSQSWYRRAEMYWSIVFIFFGLLEFVENVLA
jgi:hypothetical protein